MNNRNPLVIAAIAVLLVGFGFYHFALQPKQKTADAAQAQIDEAQSRLDAAQAALASNVTARKSYRSNYTQVVRLGKAVPADDDVRSLVVQLDQVAHRTHVDFVSIEAGDASGAAAAASATSSAPTGAGASRPPGATIGAAGFPIMPLTFTFEGAFFRMSTFFKQLDDFVRTSNDSIGVNGRLLTVDAVKLAPSEGGFPTLQATVDATSYLISPLEDATGGGTAAGPSGTTTDAAGGTSTVTTTAAVTAGGIR